MPVDLYVDYTMKKNNHYRHLWFEKYHVSYNSLNMVMLWVDLLNMDSPNQAVARWAYRISCTCGASGRQAAS